MSSPFFSELAKLDSLLLTIQSQVERLRSGLDDDENQLKQRLAEARQHASVLRDLIRATSAEAKWNDREALEHLILALEIAADEKRIQERRSKLLELASELEAGSVKHRASARAEALNSLRVKAVTQLRDLAARNEQEKAVPGPEASQWVHWVCNLQEEKDAATLAELGANCSALYEFAASLEESFWVPGERATVSAPAVQVSAATTELPATPTSEAPAIPIRSISSTVRVGRLPQEVKAQFEKAVHTGDFRDALSLCYDPAASETAFASRSEATTPEQPPAVSTSKEALSTTEAAPPPLKYCEECGRTYPHRYKVCPFDSTALKDLPDAAPEMPEIASLPDRYRIPQPALEKAAGAARTTDGAEAKVSPPIPVAQSAEAGAVPQTESSPADMLPSSAPPSFATLDEVGSRKRSMTTWIAVAALVALCTIFAWTYYAPFHSKKSDAQMQVAQAAVKGDAAKPLLHREAAEGAQNNILLSMENCARANSAGIECWGYISNQRDKDSKVSLYRVDVVDGKGNSFDLWSKGQPSFSDTHDFNVPAQSKVKYSIKVPDNDKDARTLTLYLDVSNPKGSEYTFRDVPVSD